MEEEQKRFEAEKKILEQKALKEELQAQNQETSVAKNDSES